jgi:hypothetical protein
MDRLPYNLPHTDATHDEPFRRIEPITGAAHRGQSRTRQGLSPRARSAEPGVTVTDVDRRYGIHHNQIYG